MWWVSTISGDFGPFESEDEAQDFVIDYDYDDYEVQFIEE